MIFCASGYHADDDDEAYTSVIGSKSTDIIYARDLVYKVMRRSPQGACGIIRSCMI